MIRPFNVYASLVMRGGLTWREHLRCVALRNDVCPSTPSQCFLCHSAWSTHHVPHTCPFRSFFWCCLYTRLAEAISKHVSQWAEDMPTMWGVLVRWRGVWLGLAVQRPEACPVPGVQWFLRTANGRLNPPLSHWERHGVPQERLFSSVRRCLVIVHRLMELPHVLVSPQPPPFVHPGPNTTPWNMPSCTRPIPSRLSNGTSTRSHHPSGQRIVYYVTRTRVCSCLFEATTYGSYARSQL